MTPIAIWHRVLSQGVNHESYELNSHDAELFLRQHHQLRGAPLRRLKTEIKDSGPDPLLTARPPVGAVSLPSTKHYKRRRCNDRLELTTLGRQLLNTDTARTKLGKDSVIWRLIEACAGDEQCDQPTGVASNCKCALRVEWSATPKQIQAGLIQCDIRGQHKADGKWMPPLFQRSEQGVAKLSAALTQVETLKVELAVVTGRDGVIGAQAANSVGSANSDGSASAMLGHKGTAGPAVAARLGHIVISSSDSDSDTEGPADRNIATVQKELAKESTVVQQLRREIKLPVSNVTREKIRQLTAEGHKATDVQMLLQSRFDDEAAGTNRAAQIAPPVVYIQGVQDKMRQTFRHHLGPYTHLAQMNDELARPEHLRCIWYQEDVPYAQDEIGRSQEEREAALWGCIYSTVELIDAAVDADVACIDTKWRTCSDGSPRNAIMAGRRRTQPKPGEAPIPELTLGYEHYDFNVAAIGFWNLDNYNANRNMFLAMDNMMPCDNPDCSHPITREAFAHGRGFYLIRRQCHAQRKRFRPPAMIDKAGYLARALNSLWITILLCAFHVYAAFLKYHPHTYPGRLKHQSCIDWGAPLELSCTPRTRRGSFA